MRLLIVTGLPATGKTTLARQLARRYGVPLLSKDRIKEPLFDSMGAGDRADSRRLSDLSFAVLFALAADWAAADMDLILEGNFRAGEHETPLHALTSARLAQILCRLDETQRQQRMAARSQDSSRHPGHRDATLAVPDPTNDHFLNLVGERFVFENNDFDLEAVDRWWQQ